MASLVHSVTHGSASSDVSVLKIRATSVGSAPRPMNSCIRILAPSAKPGSLNGFTPERCWTANGTPVCGFNCGAAASAILAPAAISKNPRRVGLFPVGLSDDDKSDVGMMSLAFPKKLCHERGCFRQMADHRNRWFAGFAFPDTSSPHSSILFRQEDPA